MALVLAEATGARIGAIRGLSGRTLARIRLRSRS